MNEPIDMENTKASTSFEVTETSEDVQLLSPGWLILITIAAGFIASGPLAGAMLRRFGYRRAGWITGVGTGATGMGIILLSILWNVEWYWNAIALTSVHLILGLVLFFLINPLYQRFRKKDQPPAEPRGSLQAVAVGIVGGGMLSGLIGFFCLNLYFLLSDRLLSTFMPVTFEDYFVAAKFAGGIIPLILAGAIAGGIAGRFLPRIRPGQMMIYALGLVFAYVTWLTGMDIAVAVPGFQAGAATGKGWEALMMPYYVGNLLFGLWWCVVLLFYMMKPEKMLWKAGRAVHVVALNLCAAVIVAITFGYTSDMFLSLGRHFERNADTGKALECYQRGLRKEPEKKVASYLQYRVALLFHRLGQTKSAKRGFQRVVAKYNANQNLVKKANHFIENLERADKGRRVVLPGVETCTEYKGAYCVPNSLALAMRYWGSDVTAREIGANITGLGSGTFVVSQTWFAEQHGYRHEFLPMAGLDDIKACIDAQLPVLVYVPYHVFAVVGYDETLNTFVTYDVATNDVWVEYLQKDFIKAWKKEGATLVLVYPPEKENMVPEQIRHRLQQFSRNYLHFQLHYFDAPEGSISIPHLLKAAGDTGEFFFPLTVLYSQFPGIRNRVSQNYSTDRVMQAIWKYFRDDFDEGVHGPGQYHNEDYAEADWALEYSVQFLIGHGKYDLVEDLLKHIDQEGQLSDEMQEYEGMINMARGEFPKGLDRLVTSGETLNPFYAGLAHHEIGDDRAGVRELTKVVTDSAGEQYGCGTRYRSGVYFNDYKSRLALDEYGFPELAAANQVLLGVDDHGESWEDLESGWWVLINQLPFNTPICRKLADSYKERLDELTQAGKTAEASRLSRGIRLLENRVRYYDLTNFQSE